MLLAATVSPTLQPIHHLARSARAHGPALLAGAQDPHAELMALVWGPRFDREHAQSLLAAMPLPERAIIQTLEQAALQFDNLALVQQQRVRQLIRRHSLSPLASGTMR
jgi:hypothetical protein